MSNDDHTTDQEAHPPDGDSGATQATDATANSHNAEGIRATTEFRAQPRDSREVIGGRYKLIECVGEGGMGTVWRAEQNEPVKRQVAVKLIKAGMDSKAVLSRFETERQALAVMDHPNIARIFDGGVTESGAPYFVMELVRGVSITEYCDSRKLTLRDRLELFIPVCQAIQHAHQKGIIHRDIKPSNVLVTMIDDRPVPKVIDFGVAKATGASMLGSMENTGANHIVGTPEYMSPEQASLNSLDIDTRSDVYSLGVLLYELLSGSTPFKNEELKKAAMLEVLRVIREDDPPRPSTKLSSAAELPSLSASRSMEPKSMMTMLRLELDWIVMKALEKDRVRRYETANAFASDVGRYLAGEAVLAHPPSKAYRLRKLLRRHKVPVLAAAGILVSLIAGVVGTTFGLARANQQRLKAEASQRTAEESQLEAEQNYQLARGAVDRYLTQVSENQLLNEPHMEELRHDLLESAREFYQTFAERRHNDDAALADLASARRSLGEISWRIGDHDDAITEMEASVEALESIAKDDAPVSFEYLKSALRLSSYFQQLGRFDDSLEVLNETLEIASAQHKAEPKNASLAEAFAALLELRGTVHRRLNDVESAKSDFQEAEEVLQQLVKQYPSAHTYSRDLSKIYTHRAQIAFAAREDQEAEELHREALRIRRSIATLEPNSVEALTGLTAVLNNLGGTLRRRNRLEEGAKMLEEGIQISRKLSADHPEIASFQSDLAKALANLSVVYKVGGDQDRADEFNQESMEVLERLTKQFPSVFDYSLTLAISEGNEGNSRLSLGEYDNAIAWYDRSNTTLESLRQKAEDPRINRLGRNNHWGRADAFVAAKKYQESFSAFDEAIALADERTKPEIRLAKANALALSGDFDAASAAVDAETNAETAEGIVCFDGAKVLVVSALAAKKDDSLQSETRDSTCDQLLTKAIDGLKKAAELNYFSNARSVSELEQSAFEPLVEHDAFQSFVAELKAKYPN